MPCLKRSLAECDSLVSWTGVTCYEAVMSAKKIVRIDGLRFDTLEEFFDHFTEKALDSSSWGKNLDAFNDVLRGGFGTPEDGFVIEWQNHERSKECLGFDETIRQLQLRLLRCHPSNVAHVTEQLMAARRREGSTERLRPLHHHFGRASRSALRIGQRPYDLGTAPRFLPLFIGEREGTVLRQ